MLKPAPSPPTGVMLLIVACVVGVVLPISLCSYEFSSSRISPWLHAWGKFDEVTQPIWAKWFRYSKEAAQIKSMRRRAKGYEKEGKLDLAEEGYLKSAMLFRNTFGADKPELCYYLRPLARLYIKQNRPDQAIRVLQKMVSIKQNWIKTHRTNVRFLNDLLMLDMADLAEANLLKGSTKLADAQYKQAFEYFARGNTTFHGGMGFAAKRRRPLFEFFHSYYAHLSSAGRTVEGNEVDQVCMKMFDKHAWSDPHSPTRSSQFLMFQ